MKFASGYSLETQRSCRIHGTRRLPRLDTDVSSGSVATIHRARPIAPFYGRWRDNLGVTSLNWLCDPPVGALTRTSSLFGLGSPSSGSPWVGGISLTQVRQRPHRLHGSYATGYRSKPLEVQSLHLGYSDLSCTRVLSNVLRDQEDSRLIETQHNIADPPSRIRAARVSTIRV